MKKYYLAYGSNLNIENMLARCPSAMPVGITTIKNCKLEFRGSPGFSYLTLTASKGDIVPLGVWEINESDEKHLDRYEGYPKLYRKAKASDVHVQAFIGEDLVVNAFLYLMNDNYPVSIPAQFYVDDCITGFKDFNLPLEALNSAINQVIGETNE